LSVRRRSVSEDGHREAPRPLSASRVESSLAALALALSLPVFLALGGGGSDLVERQEFGLALLWGLGLAVLFGLLPQARPRRALMCALAFCAALALLTGASALWAESAERASAEFARVVLYLGVIGLVATGVNGRTWRAAAAGLAGAAMLIPVLAVTSRTLPGLFDLLGIDPLANRRLAYPLGYWNAVGAWSAMAVAAGIAYSAHLRAGMWRSAALALTPVAGVALYLTYSRGAVIAVVAGLVTVIFVSRSRGTAAIHAMAATLAIGIAIAVVRSQPQVADGVGVDGSGWVLLALVAGAAGCWALASSTAKRAFASARKAILRAAAVTAVIAGVLSAIVVGGGFAGVSAGETPASDAYTVESSDPAHRLASLDTTRYEIWESAGRAFTSAPLAGIGAGSFEFWWSRDGQVDESLRDAHSLYLETAAELGLAGTLLLVGFLASLGFGAVRESGGARSAGDAGAAAAMISIFVVYVCVAGFDWMWESVAVSLLGLSAPAVVIASGSRALGRRARSRRPLIRAGAVAVLVGLGATQIPGLVSTQRVRASLTELEASDLDGAIAEASEAIEAQPWAATPYAQRALAFLAGEEFARAERDARAALKRERTNWRHWSLLAQIRGGAGDTAGALDALGQARVRSPLPEETFEAAEAAIRTSALPVDGE
jgi:hypothetical protein